MTQCQLNIFICGLRKKNRIKLNSFMNLRYDMRIEKKWKKMKIQFRFFSSFRIHVTDTYESVQLIIFYALSKLYEFLVTIASLIENKKVHLALLEFSRYALRVHTGNFGRDFCYN